MLRHWFFADYRFPLALILTLALNACGLGVDDVTRIERARAAAAQDDFRAAVIELKNVLRGAPDNVEARALLGDISLRAGDVDTAVKELQRARELGAPADDYLPELARALLANGRYAELRLLDPSEIADDRRRAVMLIARGDALLAEQELLAAERDYSSARELLGGSDEALLGLARVARERGELERAEQMIMEVLQTSPDFAAALAAMARLQYRSARYAEAAANFSRAAAAVGRERHPRERLTYLSGQLEAELAQSDTDAARATAQTLLEIAPEHPFVQFLAARVDYRTGDFDAAIDKTQAIVVNRPDYQPARLLLAAAALARENFTLAEMHLKSVVSAQPTNLEARRLLAQARLRLSRPEDALAALQPSLDSNVADPRALAMAGTASLIRGDRDASVAYFERGLSAASDDPGVRLEAAAGFLAAGSLDRAIEILESLPSEHAQRDLLLVLARIRQGDSDGARADAERVLRERPGEASSHRLMGGFHLALGELDAARQQFDAALQLDPDDLGAIVNLVRIDLREDRAEAAQDRLQGLLKRQPKSLVGLLSLAQIADSRGDGDEVQRLLERARVANPDAVEPVLLLAQFYLRDGELALAAERANAAIELTPSSAAAYRALGRIRLEQNRPSEAVTQLKEALTLAPTDVEARFQLARAQSALGMADAARQSLELVLKHDPGHVASRVSLTRMNILRGRHDRARELAVGLREEFPERATPWQLEGDVELAAGNATAALKAFREARRLEPSRELVFRIVQALRGTGDAQPWQPLEAWLDDNPGDDAVRIALGQLYQAAGRGAEAIEQYETALKTLPDNVVALNNLAWLYSELGGADNLARAVAVAARAHERLPDSGAVTDTYGWLLLLQGEVARARELLRTAAAQLPDDPEIRYHLAVALQREGQAGAARDLLDEILGAESDFASRAEAAALREEL